MKVTGFSFSSGGLLLPYHIGVLAGLEYQGVVTASTPLAGASAGSIAATAHACGISDEQILEATIQLSDHAASQGGARGRLMPGLQSKLKELLQEEQLEYLKARPGGLVIAYRELFPNYRSCHYTQDNFETVQDLHAAICHSSMFPFFTTNWPVALDWSSGSSSSFASSDDVANAAAVSSAGTFAGKLPRLVVDGFFAVPPSRHGCPDFALAGIPVDRTVMVAPFPPSFIGLDSTKRNCISPLVEDEQNGMSQIRQAGTLLRLATQPSSRKDLIALYESGFQDAERWCKEHANNDDSVQLLV